jgi:hypothetical protein
LQVTLCSGFAAAAKLRKIEFYIPRPIAYVYFARPKDTPFGAAMKKKRYLGYLDGMAKRSYNLYD